MKKYTYWVSYRKYEKYSDWIKITDEEITLYFNESGINNLHNGKIEYSDTAKYAATIDNKPPRPINITVNYGIFTETITI